MTTTTDHDHGVQHRHGCPRPGFTVQQSQAMPSWAIIRCAGCQAPALMSARPRDDR